jgi:plasmid stabilization system protein ParE
VEGFEDIKVYYLVVEREVRIVRILHGRRDIDRILDGSPIFLSEL